MSAKKLQEALYEYCSAKPVLAKLMPIAGILVFLQPAMILLFWLIMLLEQPTVFFIPLQILSWLFWGSVILLFAQNDLLKIILASFSSAVLVLFMGYQYSVFIYLFLAIIAFLSYRKSEKGKSMLEKIKRKKHKADKAKVLPFPQAVYADLCPQCGEYLRRNANFCPSCGVAVRLAKPSAPVREQNTGESQNNGAACAQCGQELTEKQSFCPQCGLAREINEPPIND